MMNCKESTKHIGEYVDRTLDAETTAHIRAHMETCSRCASFADELRRTSSLVSSLPRAGAPAGFEERLRSRLLTQQKSPVPPSEVAGLWSRLREMVALPDAGRRWAIRPVLAGALLCATIAGSLLLHGWAPIHPGARASDMDWAYISTIRRQHESFAATSPLADESAVMLTERSLDVSDRM